MENVPPFLQSKAAETQRQGRGATTAGTHRARVLRLYSAQKFDHELASYVHLFPEL